MKIFSLQNMSHYLLWLMIVVIICPVTIDAQIRNNISNGFNAVALSDYFKPIKGIREDIKEGFSDISTGHRKSGDIGEHKKQITNIQFNENAQFSVVSSQRCNTQYILYRNVVRKNLWLEGQGEPISQDVADKLPYYFRLSMKNKKGHYQFVESLHGKELSSDHDISPYILNKKNMSELDTVSNIWDLRFATIGQWLITSNLDGDKVVEERAYEAKAEGANLIYAFQPIYIDNHHVTGSYTDSWGLPIDINESDDHNYGSVVYVTLNSQGLDSIVDHIDSMGMCRYNEYGVDQTRYQFDNQKRIISITSHNTVGDPIKDVRGICGTLFEYDDNNNTCIITHVDDNLRPVLYETSSTLENRFSMALLKYDKFGRREELINMDPDESKKSFQTLKYEYSDTGILVDISLN